MATLTLRFKQTNLNTYPLDRNETIKIGRSAENDVVIDNSAVSGFHAQITADELGFSVKDMGSTNGTFIDGKPVKTRRLNDGDVILIGKHELLFADTESPVDMDSRSAKQPPRPLDTSENHTVFLSTKSQKEMLLKDSNLGRKSPLLIVKYKDAVIYKHLLKNKQTEIGRVPGNEVVIDNAAVSSKHALIVRGDAGFSIQDLKSKNGTFVNKKLVTSCQLQSGDVITIGRHELVFEEAGNYTLADTAQTFADEALSSTDQTVYLSTKGHREMLGRHGNESQKAAVISFLAGGKGELPVRKKMIRIGKDRTSDIVVTGLLIGKTAAVIVSEPNGYYLKYKAGFRKPAVNGKKIRSSVKLTDSDIIKIGSVTLQFNN